MVFIKKKKEGGSLNEVRFKQELLKKTTNNFFGTHQMCGGLKQCSVSRRVLRRKRRWLIENQLVSFKKAYEPALLFHILDAISYSHK